jgi:hypothetical protein
VVSPPRTQPKLEWSSEHLSSSNPHPRRIVSPLFHLSHDHGPSDSGFILLIHHPAIIPTHLYLFSYLINIPGPLINRPILPDADPTTVDTLLLHSNTIANDYQTARVQIYFKMVCTTPSLTVESHEEVPMATASGIESRKPYRRRHSSFHPRRNSTESGMDGEDRLLLKVCTG